MAHLILTLGVSGIIADNPARNTASNLRLPSCAAFPAFPYLSLMGIDVSPSLSQFLIRSWLVHFIFTLAFVVVILLVKTHYSDGSATRTDFLVNLISLPLCWTHTIIVLILSLKRFARKSTIPGVILLAHFFISSFVGYYLFMILSIYGWAYTMKGH